MDAHNAKRIIFCIKTHVFHSAHLRWRLKFLNYAFRIRKVINFFNHFKHTNKIFINTIYRIYFIVECFPTAKIKNRNSFFFMDGTDFNLNVNLVDCNRPLKLQWVTSLEETIIKENGKSLFLDSSKVQIPRNHTFELFLYDELEKEILDRDKLVTEFMTVKSFLIF